MNLIALALACLLLGWLGGVLSGAAWLLWALRRKSDAPAEVRRAHGVKGEKRWR